MAAPRADIPAGHSSISTEIRRRVEPDVASQLAQILHSPRPVRPATPLSWPEVRAMSARPGTGGRRNRAPRGVDSEATRELRKLLGEPEVYHHRGVRMEVYEHTKDGAGVVAVRLSDRDVQQGETALGQARAILELCDRNLLAPRYVVVSLRCNRSVEYQDRIDWAFMRNGAAEGWLRWVAYREPDRVSRNTLASLLFFRDLRAADVDLWMASTGRRIDLEDPSEVFVLHTFTNVGAFEGAQIKKRTQPPIIRRYLEEGRGWPKQPRFGFRRDARGFLEVDPEQWPFVLRLHHDYAALDELGGGSLNRLVDHLEALGCRLSRSQAHRILRDPIYVTGEWTSTYSGVSYPCRRVELTEPVPQAVFDRNQSLLASSRGAHRRRPIGYFALGRTQLLHAGCAEHGRRDAHHLLRGFDEHYRHRKCPLDSCRGFAVPRAVLDELVMSALLGFCESEEIQREWMALAGTPRQQADGVPTDDQVIAVKEDLRLRRRQLEQANRTWLDGLRGPVDEESVGAFRRATDALAQEVEALERRLAYADALRQAQTRPVASEPRAELLQRAREVLTPEVPDDPDLAQRRAAFIDAALSEVIVDIQDGELVVELRGALVGDGAMVRDPLVSIGNEDCPAEVALRDSPRSQRRKRGACSPMWVSPPLRRRIECAGRGWSASRRRARDEEILDVLRVASAALPPGPLSMATIAREGQTPSHDALELYVQRWLGGVGHAWRSALGDEVALRLGRVPPQTTSEWHLVIGWAIDHGLRFGPGWSDRWRGAAREQPWLPDWRRLVKAQRALGFSVEDIVAAHARAGRDAGPAKRNAGWWRPSEFGDCLRAIRLAHERSDRGRMTWSLIARATAGDETVPVVRTMQWRLAERRLSLRRATLLALGPEIAVTHGRVVPHERSDWESLVREALGMGLDPQRAAGSWEELRRRHPWLPSRRAFSACDIGETLSELAARIHETRKG